jgi:hypothetical protein
MMNMGLFADSFQQPLIYREELKVSRGKRLYSSGLPITGDGNLYILCRNVNVGCQKKFSDSEEYAGRLRKEEASAPMLNNGHACPSGTTSL